MKVLLVVISLFVSIAASANYDCYRKALNDFSADSMSFQLYSEEAAASFEKKPENSAVAAVRDLEEKIGCDVKSFEIGEVSCKDVVPGNLLSRVCYAESQHGYFFISMDMMENMNVVFNRWD